MNEGVHTREGAGLGLQSGPRSGPDWDPDAERQLMVQVAGGDHTEAVEALYDTYSRQIFLLGRRYLRDSGAAEDLVQKTFVRLWRSASSYDPGKGSVRTFIFTIARRVAIDIKRRSDVRPALANDDRNALDRADPASVAGFDRALDVLDLNEALAALPPAQAEVIRLTFLADMTQPQAAAELGVPLGTIKSRTHHAMQALRARLELHD